MDHLKILATQNFQMIHAPIKVISEEKNAYP